MINQPKFGTNEYYQWKEDQIKDERREFELHKTATELKQQHERELKKLELDIKRTEISLKTTLKVLIYIPIVFLALPPITLLGLFKRPIPKQLLDLLNYE